MIALADYTPPAVPKEHALRVAWSRLQQRITGDSDEDPLLPRGGLERSSRHVLDDLADPPDCAPVLQSLAENLGASAAGSRTAPRLQFVVVPPCDRTGTVETWARAAGHAVLPAPERGPDTDLGHSAATPGLEGEGLLVVPRLERWFLRQRHGLHAVRALLIGLAASERRCVVGCDAWAWRYLAKAADAELMLPRPLTFHPFDAARLQCWFAELAADGGDDVTFRLARNGENVLATDEAGQPCSNWLHQLAARSGGIPWVAWHLWRASLQVRIEETALSDRAARAVAGDRQTVWIVDTEDFRLPSAHEGRSMLALQALLIHGRLTADEVHAVLPSTGEPNVLPALVTSGHLRCEHGRYSVRPTAYPAVRQALQAADFPMGAI